MFQGNLYEFVLKELNSIPNVKVVNTVDIGCAEVEDTEYANLREIVVEFEKSQTKFIGIVPTEKDLVSIDDIVAKLTPLLGKPFIHSRIMLQYNIETVSSKETSKQGVNITTQPYYSKFLDKCISRT